MTKEEAITILTTSFPLVLRTSTGEYDEALSMAIKALQGTPEAKFGIWTPCSQGLPKDNEDVLVTYRKLNKGTRLVSKSKYYKRDGRKVRGWKHFGSAVTAWMPLPEPYKGEQHEHD